MRLARMDMRKLVGRNFGKLRREKGFTQEQFAEISGFIQQYVRVGSSGDGATLPW